MLRPAMTTRAAIFDFSFVALALALMALAAAMVHRLP